MELAEKERIVAILLHNYSDLMNFLSFDGCMTNEEFNATITITTLPRCKYI